MIITSNAQILFSKSCPPLEETRDPCRKSGLPGWGRENTSLEQFAILESKQVLKD